MSTHIQTHATKDGKIRSATLALPLAMFRAIPDEAVFDVEFVDEGILYRFAGTEPRRKHGSSRPVAEPPTWAEEP